jgi:hypothetical protein
VDSLPCHGGKKTESGLKVDSRESLLDGGDRGPAIVVGAPGETDEFGINIVADPVHVHDYHATILYVMGIDHTRLVYRYAGRDFRLTDVGGEVVRQLLS